VADVVEGLSLGLLGVVGCSSFCRLGGILARLVDGHGKRRERRGRTTPAIRAK
jgi:hypothetical protein